MNVTAPHRQPLTPRRILEAVGEGIGFEGLASLVGRSAGSHDLRSMLNSMLVSGHIVRVPLQRTHRDGSPYWDILPGPNAADVFSAPDAAPAATSGAGRRTATTAGGGDEYPFPPSGVIDTGGDDDQPAARPEERKRRREPQPPPSMESFNTSTADTSDLARRIREEYERIKNANDDEVVNLNLLFTNLREHEPNLKRATFEEAMRRLYGDHAVVPVEINMHPHLGEDGRRERFVVIDPYRRSDYGVDTLYHDVRSLRYGPARTILDPLSEPYVRYIAHRMGVDESGTVDEIRDRIAVQADRNCDAWLPRAEDSTEAAKLLYQVDRDPASVWQMPEQERELIDSAARRVLQEQHGQDGFVVRSLRARAMRWIGFNRRTGRAPRYGPE